MPLSREEEIKEKATAIGFDAIGITSAEPPGHEKHMAAWLSAGMHGAMGYLEKRAELRAGSLSDERLLPEARSVLAVAISYDFGKVRPALTPGPSPNSGRGESELPKRATGSDTVIDPRDSPLPELGEGPGVRAGQTSGTVARYARGEDYHLVLREKLNELGKWIEEAFPGAKTRGFTDSGPIRERELAARAGLGWQGKHTNLISLELGNWFFLGALLTTLDLTPDPPFAGHHCGTCTRCLTACPTGCLIAPYTLDARRCISYLTIELKDPIPPDLRPLLGDRIFGCDDCLAACPWNERAVSGREMRLAARAEDAAHPDLLAWLAVTESEASFKAKFAGTPLLRPGRVGLRRNVCVALGNVGGVWVVTPLAEVLQTEPSPIVRGAAVWALQQIGKRDSSATTACQNALLSARTTETDPDVLSEMDE